MKRIKDIIIRLKEQKKRQLGEQRKAMKRIKDIIIQLEKQKKNRRQIGEEENKKNNKKQ